MTSPWVGVVIFFAAFITPIAVFMIYAQLVMRWPFRKLTPYMVVYTAGFGVLVGYGMRLRGWDLVAAVIIGATAAWLGMRSWSQVVESLAESREKKNAG